jgi:hypothetical protein
MLRVTDVNKAATTMWDFDSTTLGYFFSSLLWVALAGRQSKTTCRGVEEGLFWKFVCDFAGVHLVWGIHRKRARRGN